MISEPGQLFNSWDSVFPNWRVWILKQDVTEEPSYNAPLNSNNNTMPRSDCDMYIRRSVPIQNTCYLRGISLRWGFNANRRSPARSVSRITLDSWNLT